MAEQTQRQDIAILWQSARLTLTGEYVVAPEILRVHGSAIGTLGNFSASIGKAKSKKTFNVSAIVAAALKNGVVLQYDAELPDNKRKILYVDYRTKSLPLPKSDETHRSYGRTTDERRTEEFGVPYIAPTHARHRLCPHQSCNVGYGKNRNDES